MRSIQWAPPGRVTWLWPSTIPGTIVVPEASTISGGGPEPGSPSSALGRLGVGRPDERERRRLAVELDRDDRTEDDPAGHALVGCVVDDDGKPEAILEQANAALEE